MSQWKREFPLNVRDALMKAEELINSASTSGRHQGLKQSEIALELITDTVFCEHERRGCSKTLTCLQEAELMEVISDHMLYDARGNEASRTALFQALFPPSATSRINFLVSLISLAISTRNAPVLKASSILLQQTGCSSSFSGTVAKGLVEEFFILVNTNCQVVIDLPKIAPLFTIVFLASLTQGYLCIDGKSSHRFPPDCFVEVITRWIRENRSLCFGLDFRPGFRLQVLHVGLFTWCIMSCLSGRGEVYEELYEILSSNYQGGYLLDSADLSPLVTRLSSLSAGSCPATFERGETFTSSLDRFTRFLNLVGNKNSLFVDQKKGAEQELPAVREQLPENVDCLSLSSFDQYLSADGTEDTDEDPLLRDNFFSTFMDAISSSEE